MQRPDLQFPGISRDAVPLASYAYRVTQEAETALVLALMITGMVAVGLNMLNCPAPGWQQDEGVYVNRAWAVLRDHRLAPTTYFYDRPPVGWILLAGWMWVTNSPQAFGGMLESGRIFMLLLHLLMVPLLYRLMRELGCGTAASVLASVFFSASPLAILYQRLVLVDTIALLFVLVSLNLLIPAKVAHHYALWSGIAFGAAVLTKGMAIVFLPAILLLTIQQRRQTMDLSVRRWLLPMLTVVALYPLYAAMVGDLLPVGQSVRAVADGALMVRSSLTDSLLQRAHDDLIALEQGTRGWKTFLNDWLRCDAVLCIGGTLAAMINLARGARRSNAGVAGLLGVLPIGSILVDQDASASSIVLAIPFLCLNIAVALTPLLVWWPASTIRVIVVLAAGLLIGSSWRAGGLLALFVDEPNANVREAIGWVKQHVPPESVLLVEEPFWAQLREPESTGPGFDRVYSYWQAGEDPAVRLGIFREDWRMVDYLLTSPDLREKLAVSSNSMAAEALSNASLVKRWGVESGPAEPHPPQVLELWKVEKTEATEAALLAGSAGFIAKRFGRSGAYAESDGSVTAEAQAYAMLRAVWMGDQRKFDASWRWTRENLVDAQGLLRWLWRDGAVADTRTWADADTDAAFALLQAGARWSDEALLDAGRRMVRAIWEREVITVGGTPYLAAGDWAVNNPVVLLNPGHFAPYAYEIFAEVDPEHGWKGILGSGYRVLQSASETVVDGSSSVGLPPDWVGLDRTSGELMLDPPGARSTSHYGYDAAQVYWRIALHQRWSNDRRAVEYLRQATFLQNEAVTKGTVAAVYMHDGEVVESRPSMVGYAGAIATLLTLDAPAAEALYASQIVGAARKNEEGTYWGDANDLYTQEWGWFTSIFYADMLPHRWHIH